MNGSPISPLPWQKKILEHELRTHELDKRRREFNDLESNNRVKTVNWPPCFPLIRHEPTEDFHENVTAYKLVIKSYRLWQLSIIFYAYNLISMTAFYFLSSNSGLFSIIYSLIFMAIFPAIFFIIGHLPVYHGLLEERRMLILLGIAGMTVQFLPWTLMAVGMLDGASGGIFTFLSLLRQQKWVLLLINSVNLLILTVMYLGSLYILKRLLSLYYNK